MRLEAMDHWSILVFDPATLPLLFAFRSSNRRINECAGFTRIAFALSWAVIISNRDLSKP